MAGVRYTVDIDLQVHGNPGAKLGSLSGQAKSIGADFAKAGQKLADGFTGAVESIGAKALTLGKVGLGAVVGAAAYGVAGLNTELESTQVSLAAVLNANGKGGGMEGAMRDAAGWMAQMKKDAKDLPGEFSDLLGIVQSGAGAAFNAGMGVDKFEAMAAQAMAASKAMQVDMHQAGRELAMLFEGRAGGHNVFGSRLGIHAQGFNDKKPEERVKILTEALKKFEPAIKVFGNTMDAQSSTLIDNAKTFLGAATGPLFDRVKGTLADANAWFDANQSTVRDWAGQAGDFLVLAFDRGKEIFLEYGPLVVTFAENARAKLISVWADMEPYVKRFGDYLKDFLSDNGSIDKLITLGKIYAAVKLGSGISGLVGGSPLGAGLAVGAAGYAAGEYAASQTGIEGLGMVGAGAGAGAMIGGKLGGPMGAGVGAGIGIFGAEVMMLDKGISDIGQAHIGEYMGLMDHNKKLQDVHGQIDTTSKEFADTVAEMESQADILTRVFGNVAANMQTAANLLNIKNMPKPDFSAHDAWQEQADQMLAAEKYKTMEMIRNRQILEEKEAKKDAEKRNKGVGGKGGTTIHKVEITVSSNQNPNQIARDVMSVIQDRRRYRPSSPRVQNWSAG